MMYSSMVGLGWHVCEIVLIHVIRNGVGDGRESMMLCSSVA